MRGQRSVHPLWRNCQAHSACNTHPHLFLSTLNDQVLGSLGVCLDGNLAATVMSHRELQDFGGVILPDRLLLRIEALALGDVFAAFLAPDVERDFKPGACWGRVNKQPRAAEHATGTQPTDRPEAHQRLCNASDQRIEYKAEERKKVRDATLGTLQCDDG